MTALQNVAVPLELSGQADAHVRATKAWLIWDFRIVSIICLISCPGVSSSVWQLHGPLPPAQNSVSR